MAETKRLPPIDARLKERFVEDVRDRRGGVHGHLREQTEKAIREYLHATKGGDTHDRLRRIEQRLDEIGEAIDSEGESGSETDSVSKTTENRIDEIMSDIRDRAEELDSSRVREDDIEAAIERIAGTSYKTVQRYKKLLSNQRALYPHPSNENVYFIKPEAFIAYVEENVPQEAANEIAETYGWEWWEDHAPSGLIEDDGRAFQ